MRCTYFHAQLNKFVMINGTKIQLDPFTLMGISVRTINKAGQSANDIGALWQRFIAENISAQIPFKLSNDTYCLYTDYESDFRGRYTTFIGCVVASESIASEGLSTLVIPQAEYLRIESKGVLPDCVIQTWNEIWNSPVERAYGADFDVYGKGCADPKNATVDIFLSIK